MFSSFFRLGTLRLTHKIIAIAGTGVLGLVLVGGLYLSGSWSQARFQKTADEASALADANDRLSIKMLEARRAEKDFLLRSDDKYAKAHGDIVKTIAESFDDIARRLAAAGQAELLNQTRAARDTYEQYVKHFGALVDSARKLGLNENDGLQGALRKAVHGIESAAIELKDVKIEARMLTMRRHEKDFMLRRDPKYGDEMNKAATDFARALAESAIPQAAKDDIAQKLAIYQRDFLAYMTGTQTVAGDQKAISDTYARFEPQIEAIEKAIVRIHDETVAASNAANAATVLQINVSILAVTLVVILLAFFIGRAISKPLSAMTAAMKELASGNFAVVLPGLGRKDEIGEMAQAVETFKVKAEEKARLEAEERQAQDRAAAEQRRIAEEREAAQQRAAEEKAAADRKAAMHKLADDFERAVGNIIETVSSASTELEAAADTLTKTARPRRSFPPWSRRRPRKPPPMCSRSPRRPKR